MTFRFRHPPVTPGGFALPHASDQRPQPINFAPGSSLALGYYRRGRGFADRVFADRVFADWSFTDRPLTNWRGLDNRLRAGEVRSDRRSRQSQQRSANDYEFQHEVPLLPLKTTRIVDLYDHYRAINSCLSKRARSFLLMWQKQHSCLKVGGRQ
jgi:hypothetical protein